MDINKAILYHSFLMLIVFAETDTISAMRLIRKVGEWGRHEFLRENDGGGQYRDKYKWSIRPILIILEPSDYLYSHKSYTPYMCY